MSRIQRGLEPGSTFLLATVERTGGPRVRPGVTG